jgi:hypothetical protein
VVLTRPGRSPSARAAVRSVAAAALLLLLLATPAAQPARADSDPASDILLTEDAYLPYPEPSRAVSRALADVLKQAHAAGYKLKVAVIAVRSDLGGVPSLYGRPRDYANFLSREIALPPSLHGGTREATKVPLLVVMPGGYGIHDAGRNAAKAIGALDPPPATGSNSDTLTKAAIRATLRLSQEAGHPLKAPKLKGGLGGSSDNSTLLTVGVLAGLLALGAGAAFWKRRSA